MIHFPIGNVSGTKNNPITDNETPFLFKNLDWNKFVNKCEQSFSDILMDENPEIFYKKFMACLKEITQECVKPKKSSKHKPIPWWTKECSIAIKTRNKAKNKLMSNISTENLNNFRSKKALAPKTLRQAERKYWQSFISNLNRFTPETKIWAYINS